MLSSHAVRLRPSNLYCKSIPVSVRTSNSQFLHCHTNRHIVTLPYTRQQHQQRGFGYTPLLAAAGLTALYVLYDNKHAHAASSQLQPPTIPSPLRQPLDIANSKLPRHIAEPIAGIDVSVAARYKRILAAVVDSIVISGISGLMLIVSGPSAILVPMISNVGYDLLTNIYFNGQTLGKMMLSIRTVREDGLSIDLYTAGVMYAGKVLNLAAFIDILWSAFNVSDDYKCLHNVFSNTVVVNSVTDFSTLFNRQHSM